MALLSLGEKVPDDAPHYIRQAEEVIRVENLGKEEWRCFL